MIKAGYERSTGYAVMQVDDEIIEFKVSQKGWRAILTLMHTINDIEDVCAHYRAIAEKSNEQFFSMYESNKRYAAMHQQLVDMARDRLGIDVDISTVH